ncbi:unnamed protein product [Ixodes pacificus]
MTASCRSCLRCSTRVAKLVIWSSKSWATPQMSSALHSPVCASSSAAASSFSAFVYVFWANSPESTIRALTHTLALTRFRPMPGFFRRKTSPCFSNQSKT